MKINFIGGPNQGKTWLMKVAQTGNVPGGRLNRTSAAEENVKVYLIPENGEIDANANTGGGGSNAVVMHTWNIPGQNWRLYENSPSFFRSSEAAVVIIACAEFEEEEDDGGYMPITAAKALINASRKFASNAPIFLCLSKCDQLRGYNKGKTVLNPVDTKVKNENGKIFQKAEQFVKDHKLQRTIVCTSAVDKNGISKLFSEIYNAICLAREKSLRAKSESASPEPVRNTNPLKLNMAHEEKKQTGGCPCKSG